MELRVLKYFLVIAREESFTKAASQLHVTQPTLSRQIAQLEEELGVKLFKRSNHNIVLSEEGMILKRRAQEILTLADKTKQDFLHKDENLEGSIAIGSGEFQSTRLLSECITAFHHKYPRVRYEFYSGNTDNICEQIERGLLDFGLMAGPIDMHKFEFINMPIEEEWGILVRKDHRLAIKESVEPKDLVIEPLIIPANTLQENKLGQWFDEYQSQMNVVLRGNLQYNEALFADHQMGVLISIRLAHYYENLQFIPLSPSLKNGTALAWKKDENFSSAAAALIQFAKQYFKNYDVDHHE